MDPVDVFVALEEEFAALDALLSGLPDDSYVLASGCEGWSVSDVLLHLAQTEEAVIASVKDEGALLGAATAAAGSASIAGVDELVERWVSSERGGPSGQVLDRWRGASTTSLSLLRAAPPDQQLQWAAAPLKPRTLATTRLAEHWIHAHDIADPLSIEYPDTDRLWHVARLAHRTIPYAFGRVGDEAPTVRLELTGPGGDRWSFGEEDAECAIDGPAGEFCRVAGRRLEPSQTSLTTRGERADRVLELVRTYA